jgi:hypothetical protein
MWLGAIWFEKALNNTALHKTYEVVVRVSCKCNFDCDEFLLSLCSTKPFICTYWFVEVLQVEYTARVAKKSFPAGQNGGISRILAAVFVCSLIFVSSAPIRKHSNFRVTTTWCTIWQQELVHGIWTNLQHGRAFLHIWGMHRRCTGDARGRCPGNTRGMPKVGVFLVWHKPPQIWLSRKCSVCTT